MTSSTTASASEPRLGPRAVSLSSEQLQLAVLRDEAGRLTAQQALLAYRRGAFAPVAGNLALGYTSDAVWLAWTVFREPTVAPKWVVRLEPATLDLVQLYRIPEQPVPDQGAQQVEPKRSGDLLPLSKRDLPSRLPSFLVELPAGRTTLLLRIRTTSQMTVIPSLSLPGPCQRKEIGDMLFLGAYYGFMATSLLFSLVAWGVVRERDYLLSFVYVLVLFAFWFCVNGLTGLYLLPEQPILANQLLGLLLCIALIVGNYFFMQLLGIDARNRTGWAVLWGINAFAVVGGASVFLGFFSVLFPWLLMSVLLSFFVIGQHALRLLGRGREDEKIFSVAYLLYGLGTTITVLTNLGVLPAIHLTLYLGQSSQLVNVLALQIGLYLKFKDYRRQAQAAEYDIELLNKKIQYDQQLQRDQRQLMRMIDHEMRTPIAIINASAQSLDLMDRGNNSDYERGRRYDKIYRAVKRLQLLVEMTKASAKDGWHSRPADQIDLIPTVKEFLAHFGTARNPIQLTAQEDLGGWILFAARHFDFVMTNLLDNALKYSPRASAIEVIIERRRKQDRHGIELSVSNQTRQSARAYCGRVFDKFTRFDEHSGEPGLGMGLYLVKQLVENSEGEIVADCPDDARFCIRLWLPMVPEERSGTTS